MKTNLTFILTSLLTIGCASPTVQYLDGARTFTAGQCKVYVYSTKEAASEIGPFREICIVSGTSSFSFDHSIDGAIKKNLPELCKCGVDTAYIQSQHRDVEMGVNGVSHVTLVGIKIK